MMLLALLPLLGGCWNRRELTDLNVNTALGFDRVVVDGRPQYRLAVLTLRPTPPSGGGAGGAGGMGQAGAGASQVITVEGNTIYDAVRNFTLRSPRQLFLGHVLLVVIGEETARGGVTEIMDFLSRHRDTRMRALVMVCDGMAAEALQSRPKFEQLTSLEVAQIMERNSRRGSKAVQTDLFHFIYDLLTPGVEAIVPRLVTVVPPEESSPIRQQAGATAPGGAGGGAAGGPGGDRPQNRTPFIEGSAVFLGDRLAGYLNREETMGWLLIRGRAGSGVIPVAFDAAEDNTSFLFLLEGESRVRPVVEEGRISFEVKLHGHGELMEQNRAAINMSKEDWSRLNELINREIVRRCQLAVARSQELRADVFGFGDLLHRKQPRRWKEIKEEWGEIFPTVTVNITSEYTVEHSGLAGESILVQ